MQTLKEPFYDADLSSAYKRSQAPLSIIGDLPQDAPSHSQSLLSPQMPPSRHCASLWTDSCNASQTSASQPFTTRLSRSMTQSNIQTRQKFAVPARRCLVVYGILWRHSPSIKMAIWTYATLSASNAVIDLRKKFRPESFLVQPAASLSLRLSLEI